MSRLSNESRKSLSLEVGAETDHLLQNFAAVTCERDLLSEEYKNMSEKLDQVSEQLAHTQAESADLIRQNASDQRELAMLRRNLLIGGGGKPILAKMYENVLGKYEELKTHHESLQQTLASESTTRKETQLKLDACVKDLSDARMRCNNLASDHDALSRQYQTLSEMNDTFQRDLHRVREERTMVKREYALVMSERDTVHKEIQKLTDDIGVVNKKLAESVSEKKVILDEKERLLAQVHSLKQGQGVQQSTNLHALQDELFVAQHERKQALDQYEAQLHEAYTARKAQEIANDNVIKLQSENEALTAKVESLMIELKDANNEAKDATRNRDMAFSEREKMRCERDEIKKTYDQLAEERERIMKQLEAEMKEHDITKEAKKRVMKELRELQPRRSGNRGNVTSSGSRRDNTDSHDSAIDAGEWGSEEISTLEGGGVSRKLKTFQYKLPRQPDMNLETGLFVTRSACRGITIGDRVVAINDTIVDSTNASRLQRLVPNSANACVIKVMRSSSPTPNDQNSRNNDNSLNGVFDHPTASQLSEHNRNNSLNEDLGRSDDSAVFTARQNVINKGIITIDVECQTTPFPRQQRNKNRKSVQNPFEDLDDVDTLAPIRNVHHANSPSVACVSSGGESHQSTSTYSDSTQASILPRHPSQKSSDSNVSFQRSTTSKREKKKTKTPRFWAKMKKSKSSSSTDKESGGTWPRLEPPPIVPIGGGHLSIFTKKKARPTLLPTTFMQPAAEPGRTPPMVRGVSTPPSSAAVTPRSMQENYSETPSSDRQRFTVSKVIRPLQKRPRPISVPINMSNGQPLTLWDEHNISNNNNALSPRRPRTPALPELQPDSCTVVSEPLPSRHSSHDSSSVSTNQSERILILNEKIKENISAVTTVQPTMTGQPITRPHTMFFDKPGFQRQRSVPPTSGADRMMSLPESEPTQKSGPQLQRSRLVTSPLNLNLQPRTARSLPRPTSARAPSSRTSSHQSIETSIKTKSLDCRRIKLSGSEKGSISLSSDRSTPTLFNRSYSPATPILQSPITGFHSVTPLHHPYSATPLPHAHSIMSPSSVTSFSSSATPMFHPCSTPLIPSPATPFPSSTPFLLDTPIPTFPGSTVSSLSNISSRRRPPVTTDPRKVKMIKGTDPIGISIVGGGEKGGIFVSRITEDSLAARAGLEYGDQLLEYNGINLRSANEEQGRAVMSQTQPGDNITFLAQYNLEKYKSSIESNLSDSLSFLKAAKQQRSCLLTPCEDNEGTMTPGTTPRSSPRIDAQPSGQPRTVHLSRGCNHVTLSGGNHSGIFISEIDEEIDDECTNDLKIGDQVLEYNSIDLSDSTLERASILFSKPNMNIKLKVYYNSVGFSKLSTEPGDLFYARALFDNISDTSAGSLRFSRNSILLVDNTHPDHTMGSWSAWLVDEHGEKTTHGKIPSKFTIERDSGIHREFDDAASCAGSTAGKKHGGTGRRSFFKRRKPHRTSSRSSGDVKLHKSVSETSIESTETNFEHTGAAYQVVSRHVCQHRRPVVIFGPHASTVCDRLTREYGNGFTRCSFDALHSSSDLHDSNIIDTIKQVTGTLALRVDTLTREMQQHRHVLLEISQDAVDRLHSHKIYPIIVFIEYNSAKKVKESQDRYPGREKISLKQSKDIFERANSVRKKLSAKYLGTVYIHGGSTHTVAKQIDTVVDREQSKVLWLPTSNDLLNY